MRWERLFAELEAQANALDLDDRDQLVDELVDETWSELSWRELLGGRVELEVTHHGLVTGEVLVANDRLVHLATATGELVINAAAILAVVEAERRAGPLSPVAAAYSWSRVWRSMRESDHDVTITRTDGSPLIGRVEHAGRDFAVVRRVGARTVVPNVAVATLSLRH